MIETHDRGKTPRNPKRQYSPWFSNTTLVVPTIVVHGYEDAQAAALAAQSIRCPVGLISVPGAAAYSGVGWFKSLIDQTAQSIHPIEMIGILDCGGRPGDVLAALRVGIRFIRFIGGTALFERLLSCAQPYDAVIFREVREYFDPRWSNDKVVACRDWLIAHASRPNEGGYFE